MTELHITPNAAREYVRKDVTRKLKNSQQLEAALKELDACTDEQINEIMLAIARERAPAITFQHDNTNWKRKLK